MTAVICGKRRFTCLTPRLVRMEFSPTGVFEDRRSVVAFTRPDPIPFDSVEERGGVLVLRAGEITLFSQENDRDFFPANLRVDFKLGSKTQTWRFGDRDYQNLGGAVRSLDYYGRQCLLSGVHPASNASPDDFFHFDSELFDTAAVYLADGHLDWQMEILREGLYDSLRYAPHRVYNRYLNMAGDLTRYQPGLLSRSGYFLLNDSTGAVIGEEGFPEERNTPGTRDLYLFAYGEDYKAALGDYRALAGAAPLPAKNIFGILFSRWPAFDDPEARQIAGRFAREGMPLSAMILDIEWHVPDFSHWDWNAETYPHPEEFIEWAHSQEMLVAVNVHPQNIYSSDSHFEPFVKAAGVEHKVRSVWEDPIAAMTIKSGADRMVSPNLGNPAEARAMQKLCCEPMIAQGIDYWWLDGASARLNGADFQLLSTRVFHETANAGDRRGLVQARYGGLGSHRYGMLFTGDADSQWEVLQSECEFNIRAGQVGIAYVTHDIGGFSHAEAPLIDPDLYIRWLEFGVFSPVLRLHSAPGAGSRQPWDYGAKNLETARRWIKIRHALMPYLYGAARQAYDTGVPLVRGLYLDHPGCAACYRFDQYLLGDSLLVAPILAPSNHRMVTLPPGGWRSFATGEFFEGGQDVHVFAPLDQVPVFVKAGTILPLQGGAEHPARVFVRDLVLDVYPGAAGEAVLYEDDGATRAYERGAFSRTRFTLEEGGGIIHVCGGAAEGSAQGELRRVSLRIAISEKPVKVEVNAHDLPAECTAYDADAHRAVVDLGEIPVRQAWEVVIRI